MAAARARLLPAAAAAVAATAAAAGGLALAQPELPALGLPSLGLAALDPPASPAAAGGAPAHGGAARRGVLPPMAQVGWVRDLAAGEGVRLVFDADSMCRTPALRDHMVPPSAAPDGSVLWPRPTPAALSGPCVPRPLAAPGLGRAATALLVPVASPATAVLDACILLGLSLQNKASQSVLTTHDAAAPACRAGMRRSARRSLCCPRARSSRRSYSAACSPTRSATTARPTGA
jgi:hypothetical protein